MSHSDLHRNRVQGTVFLYNDSLTNCFCFFPTVSIKSTQLSTGIITMDSKDSERNKKDEKEKKEAKENEGESLRSVDGNCWGERITQVGQ